MKSVPFKRCEGTGGGAELCKALSQFVQFNYKSSPNFSEADFKAVDAGLGEVKELRDRAINMSNGVQASPEPALETLQTYYGVLTEFEKRFPFGAFKTSMFSKQTPSVMVEFKWSDAFRPVKLAANHSIKFERAAVLFNVGAAFSWNAVSCDRSSDDGTKKAAQYFLKAAGVFQHLQDNAAEFSIGASQDLTTTTYQWLKELMHAQACAATFESAVLKKMSPGTVAMLATGAADQYERARTLIPGTNPLGQWLAKSNYPWYNHLAYQALCFRSAAQFWQAKQEIKDEKYGREIARLNYALELAQSSEKVEPMSKSLQDARKKLIEVIQTRLKAANKDNDTIYYEIVPKRDELPPIEAKVLGKPTEYATPPPSLPKIFEKLVPVEIQQASDQFREVVNKMFAEVSRNASEHTDMAKAILASMNLPASLEAVESDDKIPAGLKSNIVAVQQGGGIGALQVLRTEVKEAAEGCYSLFNQITDALDQELSHEKDMRKKYGVSWNRNTSEQVGAEYHRDLNMARKYLQQAKLADDKVDKNIDNSAKVLKFISQSIREIEASIPSSSSALKSPESDAVRRELDSLSELLSQRDSLVKKFEEELKNSSDITDNLMSAGKTANFDKIKEKEKKRFDDVKKEVDANVAEQDAIMASVSTANDAFVASKHSSSTLQKKQEVLHELNQGIDIYNKLTKEMNQGKKFYLDLIANCLQPLLVNVNGFCMARETEANILEEDLNRRKSVEAKTDFRDGGASAPSAPDDFEYPNWGGN